ncbi:Protein cwh43, partial [Linderina macrospora]
MALLTKQTRHFVADTYLSFIFWTVLISLGLCIWYFPLWHMGISGYEALLLSDIAPVLLGIGPLRRLLRHHRGISALLGLVGVFAYAAQDPLQRLVLVAVGTAGVMLSLASVLYEDRVPATGRLDRDIQAWEAGLLLSIAVRMFFQTNNPVWATMNEVNGGWNKTGIFFGIVALLDVVTRRSDAQAEVREAKKKDLAVPVQGKKPEAAWLPAAFGFGALLFALHSMYSDSAIIGRWTWDGYPHTGPQPVPWGGLVLMVLAGGFSVGHRIELTTGMLWWGVGSICAGLVTFVSGWTGFIPGLILAFYLGSITRSILRVLARCPPGRTFFVGIMWYNILVLGHVWVVAYEFVPGGPLLRERTWVVMIAVMLSLYGGVRSARASLVSRSGDVRHETASIQAATVARADRHRARSVFWTFVVAGWAAMFMRFPAATKTPTPYRPEQRLIT